MSDAPQCIPGICWCLIKIHSLSTAIFSWMLLCTNNSVHKQQHGAKFCCHLQTPDQARNRTVAISPRIVQRTKFMNWDNTLFTNVPHTTPNPSRESRYVILWTSYWKCFCYFTENELRMNDFHRATQLGVLKLFLIPDRVRWKPTLCLLFWTLPR